MNNKTIAAILTALILAYGGYEWYGGEEPIYPGAPGDTWCASGWNKRIDINVNNTAGGALTDYQILVNLSYNPINETSIRVYNSTSCTLRSHWCENITSGNCYGLWINYSAIAASAWCNNTAIYYDNAAASSASNGTNTFEFFDDFEGTPSWTADNAASYLSIPTYDASNQPIHPDVIHFDTAWNGYKYWMCFTPYPNGNNAFENPSIVASSDGISWEVPLGLTNPLFTPTQGYCNDPNLVYNDTSDELWIYWVNSNSPGHRTLRKTSSDGVTWSAEELCYDLAEGGTPAVIKEGSTYYMWEGYNISADQHAMLSSSTNGVNWTYINNISTTLPSGVNKIWHLNVFVYDSKYIGLFTMLMDAGGYRLYYAESTDKLNFTIQEKALLIPGVGGNWDDNWIYQTAGEFSLDGNTLYLWYTGQDGSAWHIGYTEATYETLVGGAREDWTTIQETVEYDSTAQYWSPSHSMYVSASVLSPRTQADYAHSDDIAIRNRYRKTIGTVGHPLYYGNGTHAIHIKTDGVDINYYDSGWQDTGYDITSDTWHIFEVNNLDWTAHTYNIEFDGTIIKSAALMHPVATYTDLIHLPNGAEGAMYIDDVIVRKYASPEPSATLGSEEGAAATTPVISNVTNGSISSTSQYVDWDANQTTHNQVVYDNGSVGADSTACEGQWSATHPCANASDGNWSSYAESAGALLAYAYFNYTVPTGASQSESSWHVKDAIGHANLTVPSACWSGTIYLRAMCSDIANSITWQCDNGPGWTTLHTSVANIAYEQEMKFKYTSNWDNSTAAPNITLSGLIASTQYWYQAWSYNITNTSLSDNSSTLSFTTAAGVGANDITILAGNRAMLCNWSENQTFQQIQANLTNTTDYFWYNSTSQKWIFYNVNRSINQDTIVDKHNAVIVCFNKTTTVPCNILSAETITIPSNVWYYTALRESTAKTLAQINTSITSDGCTITDHYAWKSTDGAYTNTGSYIVLPNQGFAIYCTTGCGWDGSI